MINSSIEYIRTLLDKYWECQTSVEEEKTLQDFFSGDAIPEDLESYIPIFAYRSEAQQQGVSDGFEAQLSEKLDALKTEDKKYVTIRIFLPALRVAASIALIIGIGFAIYKTATNSDPYFAETYNDPKAAIEDATFALDKLAEALKKGEEASKEKLQQLDNMNIDWEALDSIAAIEQTQIGLQSELNTEDKNL